MFDRAIKLKLTLLLWPYTIRFDFLIPKQINRCVVFHRYNLKFKFRSGLSIFNTYVTIIFLASSFFLFSNKKTPNQLFGSIYVNSANSNRIFSDESKINLTIVANLRVFFSLLLIKTVLLGITNYNNSFLCQLTWKNKKIKHIFFRLSYLT